MSEGSSEGFQSTAFTGLDPDPVGTDRQRANSLREEDPQAYELFMGELREHVGLKEHQAPTMEHVIAHVRGAGLGEGAREAAREPTPLNGSTSAVNGFLTKLLAQSDLSGPAAFEILGVCMELAVFLMDKNQKYGDSALDPVRIMSESDPTEQIKVRMDDKLSRLYRGHTGGEDAVKDLVGYWVLLRVAEKRRLVRASPEYVPPPGI
jgi:hypothetical protein